MQRGYQGQAYALLQNVCRGKRVQTRVAVNEAKEWVENLSIRRPVSDVDLGKPGRAWIFRILARNPSGRDCRICETGPQSAWHQPHVLQGAASFSFNPCSPSLWLHITALLLARERRDREEPGLGRGPRGGMEAT